jgi:hypothetical protein
VTLEIADAAGKLVRRYSSADRPDVVDPELNVPTYWVRPTPILSAEPGMHRFVWDLHFPPPEVLEHEYPISAIPGDTPLHPLGPAALPGVYTVRLSAGGRTLTAPLTVRMDPRVATPVEGIAERFRLATGIAEAMRRDSSALSQVKRLRARLAEVMPRASGEAKASVEAIVGELAALEGSGGSRRGAGSAENLSGVNGKLAAVYAIVEGSDAAPTTQAAAAVTQLQDSLAKVLARWDELRTRSLPATNAELKKAGLPAIPAE